MIQRLADRTFIFYQSHNQLGRLFSEWSTTEDKLGDSLQRAGHFLDRCVELIDFHFSSHSIRLVSLVKLKNIFMKKMHLWIFLNIKHRIVMLSSNSHLFSFIIDFIIKSFRSVVEKHEQLVDDNSKQESTLDSKRNQRDAYVIHLMTKRLLKEIFFLGKWSNEFFSSFVENEIIW